jgi:NTE family protein
MTKKVGLALSGGSARGVSHIGVLKVLDQHNVPIDFMAGTSMGALVGAMYAVDKNMDFVERFFVGEANWQSVLGLVGPALRDGLLDSQKFEQWLQDIFRGATFDTLKIPMVILATDLNTGERIEISSGDVAQAVRISMAMPPTIRPVEQDGRLLADGWLSNPLPVSVVKKAGVDVILASMVDPGGMKREIDADAMTVMIEASSRGFNIMSHYLMTDSAEEADVVIAPQVKDITLLGGVSEFAHEGMMQADILAGETEANNKLDEILKKMKG